MKHVDEILEELKHVSATVTCRACGAEVLVKGKQYTLRCPACGLNIKLEKAYLTYLKIDAYRSKGGRIKSPYRCQLCRDRGMVFLREQVNNFVYAYAYRCSCPAGMARSDLSWPVVPADKISAQVLFRPEGGGE